MNIHPLLIQFGGSLLAIFALFVLARWMKLGGKPVLADESAVRHAAGEVEDGFVAETTVIDAGGTAALAMDASGRIMLIKRHGNRFAGRVLGAKAWAETFDKGLLVNSAETQFGVITIETEKAETWVDAINRIGEAGNA